MTTTRSAPATAEPQSVDLALYALIVFVWGTSWIGMRMQVGVVAPEVSVMWRFAIAFPIMFVWAMAARQQLRYPAADHRLFAGMGASMFSINLILFYYASLLIPTGLMAVVFSLASIFNSLLAAVFLKQRLEPRLLAAGAVGVGGVALMFAPEIADSRIDWQAAQGLALSVAGTLCFCLGNIISAASQRKRLPVLAATAWGMLYGVIILLVLSLVFGRAFIIEPTAEYLFSLIWLALVASVIAFASFLTLIGRIGAARAGYLTVLFPVVALAVSTMFEGYQWTWLAILGLVLVIAGNVTVLRKGA